MRHNEEDEGEPKRSTLRQVSRKREAKLKAAGLPLNYMGKVDGESRLGRVTRMVRTQTRITHDPVKREWSPKARKVLAKVGKRGKEYAVKDRVWSRRIKEIWGGCIITGETRPGHTESHHIRDKSYRPDLRWSLANGIQLQIPDIHRLADEWPDFHKALERVGDELEAAEKGIRPPVTRNEARSLIFDLCPRIRKYAKDEEV